MSEVTPSGVLNRLLEGLPVAGRLVELCGPPGCGKTALTMQHIVDTLLGEEQARVVYLDNHGYFPEDRFLLYLATRCKSEQQRHHHSCLPLCHNFCRRSCLERLRICHTMDLLHFFVCLKRLIHDPSFMAGVRLVCVDNISWFFRSFPQEELDEKMRSIRYAGMLLRQLARTYGLSVLLNNHYATVFRERDRPESGVQQAPYLGDTWTFFLDFRIGLDGGQWARLFKSTYAVSADRLCSMPFSANW